MNGEKHTLLAGLASISGDNLSAHCLGGFRELVLHLAEFVDSV